MAQYPLSIPQTAIYEMDRFVGGSISNIAGDMVLPAGTTTEEANKCVQELVKQNDGLRTHIFLDGGSPVQEIRAYFPSEIPILSFAEKEAYQDWAEEAARQPIDIYGQLCFFVIVCVAEQMRIFMRMHHIIGDAWSVALIGNQLREFSLEKTPTISSYLTYLQSEAAYLQSARMIADKAYWLKNSDAEINYFCEKEAQSYTANRYCASLEKGLSQNVFGFCKKNQTSPYVFFLSVISAYYARITDKEEFYIGTPVLNRYGITERNTVGVFINSIPLVVRASECSFLSFCTQMSEEVSRGFRHQKFHYSLLLKSLRKQKQIPPLYDVIVSYQNIKVDGECSWFAPGMQQESLQIHIDDREGSGIFQITYDYQTEKFTESQIAEFHSHLCNLMKNCLIESNKNIYELELLDDAEKKRLLVEFNDTAADYPKDKCVHELFEEQVKKTPDKVAVVACDKTLTYRELDEQANKTAYSLMERGVQSGDIVAFSLPRISYLLSVIIGILKCGAAYLPIDVEQPQDRIDFILADSNPRFYITEDNVNNIIDGQSLLVHRDKISISAKFCVIYTSGSTGTPKGCILLHKGIVNFCSNNNVIKFIENNCVEPKGISINSVTFDYFIAENFTLLLKGYTTILCNEEESKIPQKFWDLCKNKNANLIQTTPTRYKLFFGSCDYIKAVEQVKVIVSSGETLSTDLAGFFDKFANASKFNPLGPSETSVWVLGGLYFSKYDIHVGKPIANTQIYLLDKHEHLLPIGVVGELCIAGDGVGGGYLNRPDLTAEKFVPNPFGEGKLYKTGDLARWREDGNIEYIGRNDFQVKIRGLRIELGEIEAALCAIPQISQAAVVVRKDETERKLICAFYVGSTDNRTEIRAILCKSLPRYMIPHSFTRLKAMPMTISGKIDRKSLPAVDYATLGDREYVAPTNPLQKELTKLLENILPTSPIGLTDDFFECGGDSLKAIEFITKAQNEGIYISLQSIFDNPTIEKMSEVIVRGNKEKPVLNPSLFEKYKPILQSNVINPSIALTKKSLGNLFLTGANGYLGIHILENFLLNESGVAYCLVRGKDEEESKIRMKSALQFYFDGQYTALLGSRIVVVCGNVVKEKLGLSNERYVQLTQNVNTVIHTAASVKHFGSWKYFYEINVVGTQNVIAFSRQAEAVLLHMSTLSVSGNSLADQFAVYRSNEEKHFYESSLYIEQELENVYIRSKFEAECAVLNAVLDGQKANIIRVGNLTNRYQDAKFQQNYTENAFANRMKAALEFGMLPDYLLQLYAEFSPVDFTADAIIKIAQHENEHFRVFHVNSTRPLYFDKMVSMLNKMNISIQVVDGKAFSNAIKNAAGQANTKYIFEAFVNDMDKDGKLLYDSNIQLENNFTVWYLNNLGFNWPEITMDYLNRYIMYFRELGFLTV